MSSEKFVYKFGGGKADGKADMKNLLGGKGANLAEMSNIGIPVPPGFTITTEVCTLYSEKGREEAIGLIKSQVEEGVKHIEKIMDARFGDDTNPLLVSVRSGARISMPGMMDTVLNLGLNENAVKGLAEKSGNERFAWDSYRRFVQMYGDVVLGMKPENKEDEDPFEKIIKDTKEKRGIENDTDLSVEDLKELVVKFKEAVKNSTGKDFPADPWDQLWGAIEAVFGSWDNERAIVYRKLNNIPHEWGTAVNVQAMVYGNMGDNSATGVAFTRDAATGEDIFNGEYLINAQGEDVVAGIRTPNPMNEESKNDQNKDLPTLEERMPELYKQLVDIKNKLEDDVKDMVDLEFTIEEGKLFLVQHRVGKRTATAALRIAMEMLHDKVIDEPTAVLRVVPEQLGQLLYPILDPGAEKKATPIARGLPAGPGGGNPGTAFPGTRAAAGVQGCLLQ